MRPERIIAGTDDKDSREVFEEIYRPFILDDPGKLMFMSCRASELTKYASNAMLATRISFMNELSILCERVGANIDEIRRGMGADTRIGKKFLYAGPGYGGSCFPKDVEALIISARSRGIQLSVLESVQSANRAQKKLMVQKVLNYFGEGISGKRIAVWGLAFKPGTDDVREAPALTIVRKLVESGATIVAHDPQAMTTFSKAYGESNRLIYADDAYSALEGADAMVLITEWSAYKRPDWDRVIKLLAKPVVFDFRNQYSFTSLTKLGIHYQCVGRPDSTVFQDGKTCY
jgi:UDPglucose 6-dehydrogenase